MSCVYCGGATYIDPDEGQCCDECGTRSSDFAE